MKRRLLTLLVLGVMTAGAYVGFHALTRPPPLLQTSARATPEALLAHCQDVAQPQVKALAPGIWLASGFDLANTILIETKVGHVIVDVGISPVTSARVRAALLDKAPGRIHSVIYTHSHIDHVGGARAWVEDGTEVWATDAFREHFIKQYGAFARAEMDRGARQFGRHVGPDLLKCSALGARPSLDEARKSGVRMPTRTFSGTQKLSIGGVEIELHEAHGETHDQLFVYLPAHSMLLAGDNFYAAFPNIYTIRGTSPRPVDAWIASLDQMRRLDPEWLVPSHTLPIHGRPKVRAALRNYRDGIQWVRDRVIAGANRGESLERIVESVGLPPSLEDEKNLRELYGQIDWSARAIYTNQLGWFDGRASALYPMRVEERAQKMLGLMGGAAPVLEQVDSALKQNDPRWALELLELLNQADANGAPARAERRAAALENLAHGITNTNGRAYLLESAYEARHGQQDLAQPEVDAGLVDAIPARFFFTVMTSRLDPAETAGVVESARVELTDEKTAFTITVRNGIAEIIEGPPLPETPSPLATLRLTGQTWKRLALKLTNPAAAIVSGDLAVEGDQIGLTRFMNRFQQDF